MDEMFFAFCYLSSIDDILERICNRSKIPTDSVLNENGRKRLT